MKSKLLNRKKNPKQYSIESEPATFWKDGQQLYFFDFDITKQDTPKKRKEIIADGHNTLNDLSGSEWTLHSKSVQTFNSPITAKRKKHGAAFPLSLAKHFLRIYSKPGDTILDPFAGVGTTLDASNILKRHSIGVELNKDFILLFNEGIDPKDGTQNREYNRIMIHDSALNINKHLEATSVDFILTSPPYANLLNKIRDRFADKDYNGNPYKNQSRRLAKPYSTEQADLGNLPYEDYLQKMQCVFSHLAVIAKEGTYNAWVVRDYRDMEGNIPYVNLHGDLIDIAQKEGWILWDFVIWDQSNQRKLVRLGGNKSRRFYFNIGHSFIVIFRKNIIGEKY